MCIHRLGLLIAMQSVGLTVEALFSLSTICFESSVMWCTPVREEMLLADSVKSHIVGVIVFK